MKCYTIRTQLCPARRLLLFFLVCVCVIAAVHFEQHSMALLCSREQQCESEQQSNSCLINNYYL